MKHRISHFLPFLVILLAVSCSVFKPKPPAPAPVSGAPPMVRTLGPTPPPVIRTPWTTNNIPSGGVATNITLRAPIKFASPPDGVTNSWTFDSSFNGLPGWLIDSSLEASGDIGIYGNFFTFLNSLSRMSELSPGGFGFVDSLNLGQTYRIQGGTNYPYASLVKGLLTAGMQITTNGFGYITNTWPGGPSNTINMALSAPFDQNYASFTACKFTGITGKDPVIATTKRISLYNISSTNWNLTLDPGIADASGQNPIVVSNGQHIVSLISYSPQGPATNMITSWFPGFSASGGAPVAAGTNGIAAITNAGVVTISFTGNGIVFRGVNTFGTNVLTGLLTIDDHGNLSVYGTNTAVLTFYDSNTNPIAGWDGVMFYGDAGLLTDVPAASLTNSQGVAPVNVMPAIWDSFSIPASAWFSNNLALGASFIQPTNTGDGWIMASNTTNEVRFRCNAPINWDTNAMYAQFRGLSLGTNHSTTTNVVLAISGMAIGNLDREDTVSFGTEVAVTNHISTNLLTSGSAITAPFTIGNTPTPDKALVFRVRRLSPGPGGDTMTNTFVLTDVQLYYKKNLASPAVPTPSP